MGGLKLEEEEGIGMLTSLLHWPVKEPLLPWALKAYTLGHLSTTLVIHGPLPSFNTTLYPEVQSTLPSWKKK